MCVRVRVDREVPLADLLADPLSAGVRGVRYSINSDGRRTHSVGIPGTGLSYRDQSGPTRRPTAAELNDLGLPSPTRLAARTVAGLAALGFVLSIIEGWTHFGAWLLVVGVIVYIGLRILRPVLDALFVWLLTRNSPSEPGG
jgi:hypothetical protein